MALVAAAFAAPLLAARLTSDAVRWALVATIFVIVVAVSLMFAAAAGRWPSTESEETPPRIGGLVACAAVLALALVLVLGVHGPAKRPREHTPGKPVAATGTPARSTPEPSQTDSTSSQAAPRHTTTTPPPSTSTSPPATPREASAAVEANAAAAKPRVQPPTAPQSAKKGSQTGTARAGTTSGAGHSHPPANAAGSATPSGQSPQSTQSTTPSVAASRPEITHVSFSGSSFSPQVTIEGVRFGVKPTASNIAWSGDTGDDYGNSLYVCDTSSDPRSFCAGQNDQSGTGWDYVGLVVEPYTETSIQVTFGSSYQNYYYPEHIFNLGQGDEFTVHVGGATCAGSVNFDGQSIACE